MPDLIITRRSFTASAVAAGTMAALPRALAQPTDTGWIRLSTEPFRGKQDDISFVDQDHGWYGNGLGRLFGTGDGGASWTKLWDRQGTFIRALGFVDKDHGYLGNVGTGVYPNVTDSHPLYCTRDGGVSWEPVTAPGIEKVAGICGIDILPIQRIYQGELRAGHAIHAAGRVGGPAMLLRSVDDGESWSVHDFGPQAGMILDVRFHDLDTGFVCTATSADISRAEAQILRTTDGGRSWQSVYRSGRPFENCWKMSWPSRQVGYATVQSYNADPANTRRVIVKTEDGGASWQELPLIDAPGVQQFGIGFADEQRGWVGCRAGGYETLDGGASWSPAGFGPAVNKIRVVRGETSVRVFAIGVDVHRLDL